MKSIISLKVYNVLGQEIRVLIYNEILDEGFHSVEFDARDLPSGVYYYRIVAETVDDEENHLITEIGVTK